MLCRPTCCMLMGVVLSACGSLSAPPADRTETPGLAPSSSPSALHPGSSPPSGTPAAPTAGSQPAATETVDVVRRSVRRLAEWLGEEVNDWFGDKPFEEGGGVSRGRLSARVLWREDEGWDTKLRFRARFDLPNLRDKAYVFLGQDNERELVTDQPQVFSREQQLLAEDRRADQTGFVGLGFQPRARLDFRLGLRSGYKPYAQGRYRKLWALSAADRLEFRETVFWSSSEGFGSTTGFDYEHAYSPVLALRWRNAGTISQKTDGFRWSSSLGLFRSFGDQRVLSTEALVSGEAGQDADVGEYGVRLKWSQPVYREWLLAELIVGHFWPRHDGDAERGRSWAVGAGLEMRF